MSAPVSKGHLPWSSPAFRIALLLFLFIVVEAIGFYARWSLAARHDRYLLQEADGRNYNLTVEMAKRGDLTPTDLIEPTLGLYLRQPVVWASYYIARANGEVSTLDELTTRDPYGPSGFAYAVSHPIFLRANRMFSVAVSLLIVALTFALSFQILKSPGYAFVAALIPALSPELLRSSYLIDGDSLMTALCLASTLVGVRAVTSRSRTLVILCAGLSGLAGSAEYRGLWSIVIPISVWAFGDRAWPTLVYALAGSLVGFILGNPHGLFHWEAFAQGMVSDYLNGASDPIFNFKGLTNVEQASLFLGWLVEEGVGVVAGGLAAASFVYFVKCFNRRLAVFLSFPIFYLLLVFVRDTNLMRTVMVLVPYVAVMASCGLHRLSFVAEHPSVKTGAPPSLTALIVIQLGIMCVLILRGNDRGDSRDLLLEWLRSEPAKQGDIAVAAPLQLAESRLWGDDVHMLDSTTLSTAKLVQDGYRYFVTTPVYSRAPDSDLVRLARRIPGRLERKEIPDSPVIDIYALRDEGIDLAARRSPATLLLRVASSPDVSSCSDQGEAFCWISARRTSIMLGEPTKERVRATLSVRSLWDDQEVVVTTPKGTELYRGVMKASPEWSEVAFSLSAGVDAFNLTLSRIHQLPGAKDGGSLKRAGMAIRQIRLEPLGDAPPHGLSHLLAGYSEEIRGTVLEALTLVTEEFSPVSQDVPAVSVVHSEAPDGSIYDVIEQVSGEQIGRPNPALSSGATASEDAAHRSQNGDDIRRAFLNAMAASMAEDGTAAEVGKHPHLTGDAQLVDDAAPSEH
jgi:hypothetical protein